MHSIPYRLSSRVEQSGIERYQRGKNLRMVEISPLAALGRNDGLGGVR